MNYILRFIERKIRSRRVYLVAREVMWIALAPLANCRILLQLLFAFLRRKGIVKSSKYGKMEEFKDKHLNERCFIVCTGPSLTIDDLEMLDNEICFSMNSIVRLFDKTKWRPTYYGIIGPNVYFDNEEYITSENIKNIFVSNKLRKKIKASISNNTFLMLRCNRPYTLLNPHTSKYNFKQRFSDNAFSYVYGGSSVTYILLQIAVYMGFKEIYLLGCDCDYSGDNLHMAEIEYRSGEGVRFVMSRSDEIISSLISGHIKAREYADTHGIKIFNATRGGKLEIYERVNLEDVLLPER